MQRLALLLLLTSSRTTTATTVWPAPASMTASNSTVALSSGFAFAVAYGSSQTLTAAVARATKALAAAGPLSKEKGGLAALTISVAAAAAKLKWGVDESYALQIKGGKATLSAPTVYGALHGLRTFLQLADEYGPRAQPCLQVPATLAIADAPRFKWRGLMIDTGRHYYPIENIKHIVDSMVMSKLNVLHVHFSDDQSFPVQSLQWPLLTARGAFTNQSGQPLVYSHADVAELVSYAEARGVIVVPEFDMPAHSSAWGAGYPEFMVQGSCCGELFSHGATLNPTSNATYDFLDSLISELASLFTTSPFLHLGGDEVPTASWLKNDTVAAWMKEKGYDCNQTEAYFVNRVKNGPKLSKVLSKQQMSLVYWEEIFWNTGKSLPKGTVIQAWKSNAMPGVVDAGHQVTNSFKWYLNHGCDNTGDGVWQNFYANEPLQYVPKDITPAQKALIVGGETTMWAECVDSVIFDSIVWPRAAAAAEKLWSPEAATGAAACKTAAHSAVSENTCHAAGCAMKVPSASCSAEVEARMAEHRCRLVASGVRAAPLNDYTASRIVNGGCM